MHVPSPPLSWLPFFTVDHFVDELQVALAHQVGNLHSLARDLDDPEAFTAHSQTNKRRGEMPVGDPRVVDTESALRESVCVYACAR